MEASFRSFPADGLQKLAQVDAFWFLQRSLLASHRSRSVYDPFPTSPTETNQSLVRQLTYSPNSFLLATCDLELLHGLPESTFKVFSFS